MSWPGFRKLENNCSCRPDTRKHWNAYISAGVKRRLLHAVRRHMGLMKCGYGWSSTNARRNASTNSDRWTPAWSSARREYSPGNPVHTNQCRTEVLHRCSIASEPSLLPVTLPISAPLIQCYVEPGKVEDRRDDPARGAAPLEWLRWSTLNCAGCSDSVGRGQALG